MIYETLRSAHVAGDVVTFELDTPSGRPEKLRINVGMLGPLSVAIKGLQSHYDQASGGSISVQATTVTSLRKAIDDQGRAMLELGLDGVRTQVLLPSETLSALRTILAELDALTSPSPTGPHH